MTMKGWDKERARKQRNREVARALLSPNDSDIIMAIGKGALTGANAKDFSMRFPHGTLARLKRIDSMASYLPKD